jgi:hypothetical protein
MNMKAELPANPRGVMLKILLALCIAFSSVVFGLLAASANPILIGLGIGLVGGVILLATPDISIAIVIVVGLLMGALISFAGHTFDKLTWAISLLGMLLLLPVFPFIARTKQATVPGFVWLAIAFMAYALLATVLQWNTLAESLAGFKRYFQAYGLMLALAFLPLARQHFQRWQKMLLAIALLQFPFALFELLVLVPKRGGLSFDSSTTDVVAGTFGANMEGGSPGIVMVVFLLIVFCFLFSRWRSGLISNSKTLLLSAILLLPIGMGENKVAFLMVPMVWFVLIRHDLARSPVKYFPVLLSGMFLTGVLGYVYVVLIMKSNVLNVVQGTIDYNFGNAGYAFNILNRTTVLSFWWGKQGLHDPIGFFFGNGLGSAFLGQISGHIGWRYPHYGIDLTAASTLLWDLGVIGFAMFGAIFVAAWRTAGKIYRGSHDPEVRADCLAVQAAISLFLLMIIYSQDIINLISMEIVYSVVLGYLAYLYSKHNASIKTIAA